MEGGSERVIKNGTMSADLVVQKKQASEQTKSKQQSI